MSSAKLNLYNAFWAAVEGGDLHTISTLIGQGVDVNARDEGGSTALMRVALHGYQEMAKFLLNAKADPTVKDALGKTALHYAAQEHRLPMVELLVASGADVNAQDLHGNTPISSAIFYSKGRGDVISLLRNHRADLNLANKHGVTPRSLAQTIANYDVLKFLQ